jgi:hypothetical protein
VARERSQTQTQTQTRTAACTQKKRTDACAGARLPRVVTQLHVQQLQVNLALYDVALAPLSTLQPLQYGARRVQVMPQAAHALERRPVVLAPPTRLRSVATAAGGVRWCARGGARRCPHAARKRRACLCSFSRGRNTLNGFGSVTAGGGCSRRSTGLPQRLRFSTQNAYTAGDAAGRAPRKC